MRAPSRSDLTQHSGVEAPAVVAAKDADVVALVELCEDGGSGGGLAPAVHHTRLTDLEPAVYGTHSLRRTNVSLVYKKTGNLRACQLLLGHRKLESTVRYLGIEVDDALEIRTNILSGGTAYSLYHSEVSKHRFSLRFDDEVLLPHGPHSVRDVLATHVLKTTGSCEQASYAIQDTPVTVQAHYGRFLPQDKVALAAAVLNKVWA